MKSIGFVFGIVVLSLFLSFLLAYPLMLLWNQCLVPAVTVLKEVGWLQMWGINFLISMFKLNYTPEKK